MKSVYREDFTSREDVEDNFGIMLDKSVKIIFAWYGSGNYDGSVFVLFRDKGKLYEVNGSHCSCHGLGNQWLPEETTKKILMARIINGTLGNSGYYSGGSFSSVISLLWLIYYPPRINFACSGTRPPPIVFPGRTVDSFDYLIYLLSHVFSSFP